ncbi:MAG: PHP-associated domain-containing protein [Nitrospinota bacterium]
MKADLHIHTTVSDGLTGPVEALRLAASLGIDVVAITDHDTDAALPLLGEAGALPVAVLPGVEMDTRLDGLPLEILVYGHRVGAEPLAGMLAGAAGRRSRRAEILWTALRRALGAELPPLSALLPPPRRVITRPQMVDCLLEARVLPHRQGAREAVAFYDPGFDPPSTEEAFRAAKASGGLCVLAHPLQVGGADPKALIERLAGMGLDGVETAYPYAAPADQARAAEVAAWAGRLGLIGTGGSDAHRAEEIGRVTVELPEALRARLLGGR